MRILKKTLPVLGTLVLLCLGAAMPDLVSLALDRHLEQAVATRADNAASLSLSRPLELPEAMALVNGSHTEIELEGSYQMNAEEALGAASTAVNTLKAAGIVLPALSEPTVTAVLITARERPELSGIFWRCVWGDSGENLLWLDDGIGRMVAFRGRAEEVADLSDGCGAALVDFCVRYYGLSVEAEDSYRAVDGTLTLRDGQFSVVQRGDKEVTSYVSFPAILYDVRAGLLYFNLMAF